MTESLPASLFEVLKSLDGKDATGHEKYREVRKYIQFKARDQRVPVCGTFELTPLCNLSCRMCYVHLDREQLAGREPLPAENWKTILDQAVDAGLMYATLTGGECLTYGGFREVYLHLRARGVETALLTNAVALTEDMVSFLDRYPPADIQITLYGADEDEYERVTGRRVFRTVMDNLDRLRAHRLPFRLSATPNGFMTKGKELVQLLHDQGVPFEINSGLKAPREETGRELRDASRDMYLEIYTAERALAGGEVRPTVPDEDLPDPGFAGSDSAWPEKGMVCAGGRSSYCVTWDGKMKPCNTFPGIEEDVLTLGVAEAWKRVSTRVQEVLRPVECQSCPYERVCHRCIVEHLDHGNPGHVNPDVCEHVRFLVREGFIRL